MPLRGLQSRRELISRGAAALAAASLLGADNAPALPPRRTPVPIGTPPFRGVDLSYLPQLESLGVQFYDGAAPRDPFDILHDRGINLVRLRVWNNPAGGFCSVARTLAMAARAHARGMKTLIDFHYSDSWADPGQQTPPAAWAGYTISQLESAVGSFTASTLGALAAQGTPAAIAQLGNEITGGMLWPIGGNTNGWTNLARLVRAGAAGVRGASPATRIMLHIDRGGDNAGARWFFDHALANAMPFDIIGLSYYCWWHGTFAAMQANLADLAARYAKPIHVVETAYPWTLAWADSTNNFVWQSSQCLTAFAPSPAGQTAYTAARVDTLAALPNRLGEGLCWWAPDAVAATGFGSPWENLTLFDFSRHVLSGAAALGNARPATPA